MSMNFREFIEQANNLLTNFPELGEATVHQTSPFDDPYRFETGGLCGDTSYEVFYPFDGEVVATFTNAREAHERAKEESAEVREIAVVVVEGLL